MASVWAKGNILPKTYRKDNKISRAGIRVSFYDSADEAHSTYIEVSSKTDQWQYVSGSAIAPCDYTKIEYRLFYYAGKNSVIFDNAQLLKTGFGTMYEYDEKGLLIRLQDYDGNTAVYSYNEDDLVEDITYTRVGYSVPVTEHYEYNGNGDVNRHVDRDGTVTVYVYDEEGNLVGTETTDGNVSLSEGTFEKENTNYVSSYTDDTGRTLRFTFDEDRGLLTKTTDPQNQETLYYYDAGDNLIKKQKGNSYTEYAYENGKPVTVRYNTDNGTVEYHLEYDSFGNVEGISVGDQEIVSYEYLPYNDKLHKKTYSNGDCIEYVYDSAGNLTEVKENGQTAYRWNYTQSGKTGIVTDLNNDITTRYEYRDDGWIDKEVRSDGTTIDYTFNGADTVLLSKTVRKDDMVSETSYQYDSNDRVQSVVWDDTVRQNVRDGFGRVTQQQVRENGSEVYTAVIVYADKDSTHTTNRMESYTNKRNGTVTSSFRYAYDDLGRIEAIRDRYNRKREYVYDSLGQLTEETNEAEDVRYEYTYDGGGNILQAKTYSLRTNQLVGTDTYTYGNGNRKDQLTSFNGNGIVYDEAGNPITYYDGKQFGYRNGRQLETITDGSLQVQYSYNENGIRTKKQFSDGLTEWYITDGAKVMMQYRTDGDGIVSQQIVYEYDENDNVVSFSYNNEKYYYQRNGQHDIIGITDGNGTTAGEYEYDSWGKILNESDLTQIARINPYRYRGYRYDEESGFYWLHSRYYDPVVRRFINSDEVAIGVDPLAEILESNLYSYCINDPVNRVDPFGCKSKQSIKNELILAGRVVISMISLSVGAKAAFMIALGYGLCSLINTSRVAANLKNNIVSVIKKVEAALNDLDILCNKQIISSLQKKLNKFNNEFLKHKSVLNKDLKKTDWFYGLSMLTVIAGVLGSFTTARLTAGIMYNIATMIGSSATFISYVDVYTTDGLERIIKQHIAAAKRTLRLYNALGVER